jgi:Ca-activated chloride channel family protein
MNAAAVAALFAIALLLQTAPRFRTATEAVRVDVLVTDGRTPVSGLSAQDFELRDNGIVQQIDAVAVEDVPVSMMLALDTSYSVRGEALADLKSAARAAIGALGAGDRAALIAFSAEVSVRTDWTGDMDLVRQAIDTTTAGGGTALWDAAFTAMTLRDAAPGRRSLVVLFSDGDDTASWLPHTAILDRAKRSEAVVYGIGLGSGERQSGALLYRSGIRLSDDATPVTDPMLPQLADITGGQYFRADNTRALAGAFTRIVKEFRTRYLLTYTPRQVPQSGWHAIEVKLKQRRGQVRARRGYLR